MPERTRRPQIIDISPPLEPAISVFPGDTPLERETVLDLARGDAVTLSSLRSTCHLGAHVDAPSHYDRNGASSGTMRPEREVSDPPSSR